MLLEIVGGRLDRCLFCSPFFSSSGWTESKSFVVPFEEMPCEFASSPGSEGTRIEASNRRSKAVGTGLCRFSECRSLNQM